MRLSAATSHDSGRFEPLVDAIAPIRRPRGRPRQRPGQLHADTGEDFPRCRRALPHRRIRSRLARRGLESKETLGSHRGGIERTTAGLNRDRRLVIRDERRADIHEAFLPLGCALICLNVLVRWLR